MLQEALDAARDEVESEEGWATAWAIANLIPKLPPDLLPEALTIARDIPLESDRAMVLIAITARLPEVLPETFALVKSIKYESRGISKWFNHDSVSCLSELFKDMSRTGKQASPVKDLPDDFVCHSLATIMVSYFD